MVMKKILIMTMTMKTTTTKNLVNGGGDPENLAVGVDQHVGLVPNLVVPVGAANSFVFMLIHKILI